LNEGRRVFDGHLDLKHLAAVEHTILLDNVKLFAMGRAETVDKAFGGLSDRVDDQRVAFIVADGFPIQDGFGFWLCGTLR